MYNQNFKFISFKNDKKGAVTSQVLFGTFFGKSKKGVTEVTTFVLITLLIVVTSTIAYTFSKNIVENKVSEIDLDNFESYLKNIDQKVGEIQTFDDASFGLEIEFNTGRLFFEGNQIYYQSLVEYYGADYCFEDICVANVNDFERVYLNLTSPYIFENNMSLNPGSYLLLFKNIKNGSKISATFK